MALFVALAIGLLVVVWVYALADLVRSTDLDPAGRVILALALILVAPVGVLLWVVVRGGRVGVIAVATVVAGVVLGITTVASASPSVHITSTPSVHQVIR